MEASCENTVFTVETYNKVNNYLPAIDRIVSEFKSRFAENDSVVLCALGQILTDDNPDGWITMNDLELLGMIFQWLVLEYRVPNLVFKRVGINGDNTSAVSWMQKFSSTKSLIAARLLRLLSIRMHRRRASPLSAYHISGDRNTMADKASRSFKTFTDVYSSHISLESYFNSTFPLPKSESWKELTLPPALVSRVISCLRSTTFNMGQLLRLPEIDKNTGATGAHSYKNVIATTPISKLRPNLNLSSSSSAFVNGSGQAIMAADLELKLKTSVMRLRPSARPSNWLENAAPYTDMTTSTFDPSLNF